MSPQAGEAAPARGRPDDAPWWLRVVFAPGRWSARRHERRGGPVPAPTPARYAAIWLISWLCVGTVVALLVNWRGGLGPNTKAPDEQYFSWVPSAEAGRQGAVVAFVLTGVVMAIAVVIAWRQAVRDGFVERPTPGGRAREHPTDEIRHHPFPPKAPDVGMDGGTARER